MELSSLSKNIVIALLTRGGETDELSINIDAFTPEFFREVGRRFKEKMSALAAEDKKSRKGRKKDVDFFEAEARALEIHREIHAELLSRGVLTAWTVTENGTPIAPTREVLLKLPPRIVEEIWELSLDAAKTVKKRAGAEIEETSENTPNGSREHLKLAPTG